MRFRGTAVTISCTDHRRSRDFYVGVLGGVEDRGGDGYGCIWLRLGDLTLSLMPNASADATPVGWEQAQAMLWLEVDEEITAVCDYLESQGVILEGGGRQDDFVEISDPDGVRIEIWSASALDGMDAPWRRHRAS